MPNPAPPRPSFLSELFALLRHVTSSQEHWRDFRRAIGRIVHANKVEEAQQGITQLARILEKGYTNREADE